MIFGGARLRQVRKKSRSQLNLWAKNSKRVTIGVKSNNFFSLSADDKLLYLKVFVISIKIKFSERIE
jgi:hypothetical protein